MTDILFWNIFEDFSPEILTTEKKQLKPSKFGVTLRKWREVSRSIGSNVIRAHDLWRVECAKAIIDTGQGEIKHLIFNTWKNINATVYGT